MVARPIACTGAPSILAAGYMVLLLQVAHK